jgi:8-oxo-dGTP diphosphatase
MNGDESRDGQAEFERIDWTRWTPKDRAVLLFVRRDGALLLIHKKRGLGAGKINGPGGRIEPGETAREAAVREVREEVCVTPHGVRERGRLRFQFKDGYSIDCTVFDAEGCEGEPVETEEAKPFWCPIDALPYERMWADDRIWMPRLIRGEPFDGRFLFDRDRMLGFALS